MPTQVRGTAQLVGSAARALALVGADAARDRFAGALPRTPADLARPTVLGALLGSPVTEVRLPGVSFDSSNCQNFLIEVDDPDGTTRTMYAKLPASELGPRVFANTIGYWHLECAFCNRIAPYVAVRVPRVYAVRERG